MGRRPSAEACGQAQYVDLDGHVWMTAPDGTRRLAGHIPTDKPGWDVWGLEAAGPPFAPPGPSETAHFEAAILGLRKLRKCTVTVRDGSTPGQQSRLAEVPALEFAKMVWGRLEPDEREAFAAWIAKLTESPPKPDRKPKGK
jgi:hypothetical protein